MIVIKPNAVPDNDDFARAGTATYVGPDGKLKTAASDAPRYQDGVLLVEAAGSNLLQFSEDMRNTAEAGSARPWVQFDDTADAVLVAPVTTTRPDGASGSVSKLTVNTTGTLQRQVSQVVSGIADSEVVTFSLFINAVEVPRVALKIGTKASTYPGATFNLSTGGITSSVAGVLSSGAMALAGGWWRCWVVADVGTGGTTPSAIAQLKNGADADYSGTVGDGVYIWGGQLEVGSAPTSYIPRTGTAAASRVADTYTGGYIACGDLDGRWGGSYPLVLRETNDGPLWSAATAYLVDDYVVRTQTHRVYRRLIAGTTATAPENDATNWEDLEATQKYLAFDGLSSKGSGLERLYSLAFSIWLAGANAISLIGIRGVTATIKATDGAGGAVIYTASKTIGDDRYSYPAWTGAETRDYLADWHVSDIPAGYPDAVVHVVILESATLARYASVREIYLGAGFDIGETQAGARVGITDYSRKETDAFGNVAFVRRAFSKRMSCEVRVPLADFQKVYSLLADLRATVCQWIPESSGAYGPLMLQGWYRDFSIAVAYPTYLLCTLEVEGLAVDTLLES